MLVLSRDINQRIVATIGRDADGNDVNIIITIVDVSAGCKVRVGIDAPRAVPVHREEVYERDRRDRAPEGEGDGRDAGPEAECDGI